MKRPLTRALLTIMLLTSPARSGTLVENARWYELPNGLKLVVREDHSLATASAQIWVLCGGVNENQTTTYGASHYLEHMLFKGTRKYTAGQISRTIESQGGSINAATGQEFTHYYVDIPAEGLSSALDVLCDAVTNATFPKDEMERERLVILEEIKRRNDSPDAALWDSFSSTLYQKSPYHWRVIGTTESITVMKREALMKHYKTYYVPNNMVVVVTGDVKKEKILEQISKRMGPLPKRKLPPTPKLIEEQGQAVRSTLKKHVGVAHFMTGFLGPVLESPDQFPLDVLSSLLGDGRTALLNQSLREKKKVVYSVGCSFVAQRGTGMFVISGSCPPEKLGKAEAGAREVLKKFSAKSVTPEMLARAKTQIRTSWLFENETYHGQAENLAYFTLLGRKDLLKDYLTKIDQVTAQDLERVLKTYWNGRDMTTALLLPETK